MAVTLEGTFKLIDRASGTLERIERKAMAADRAVNKLGRDLDQLAAREKLARMDALASRLDKVDRTSAHLTTTSGKVSAAQGRVDQSMNRTTETLRRHERQITRTDSVLERLGRKSLLIFGGLGKLLGTLKMPLLIAGFAALVPLVTALGAGAAALLPRLVDLGGVAAPAATAFTGLGIAMVTVKLAFNDLSKAMGGNKRAIASMTPDARRFIETLKSWKPLVTDIRRSAQQGLFAGLDRGLERLKSAVPTIRRIVGQSGTAVGILGDRAAQMLSRPTFLRDFEGIARTGNAAMLLMGDAALHLVSAIRHVLVAARPLTMWLALTIHHWAVYAEHQARVGRETGRLTAYFNRTRAALTVFGHILRNLWQTFALIGKAARPLGDDLWKASERATAGWVRFLRSFQGRLAVMRFFDSTRATLHEIFGLVGDLTRALGGLGGQQAGAAGLVHGLRQMIPALQSIATSFMNTFGPPAVRLLTELARTFAILSGEGLNPIATLVDALARVLGLFNTLIDRVPALGKVLTAVFALSAISRFSRMVRGLAVNWGLVAASATAAAEAEAAAGGASLLGGVGRRGGRAGPGGVMALPGTRYGTPVAVRTAATAAGAGRLTGLLGGAGRFGGALARGAGRLAWPLALAAGGFDALTARRGGGFAEQAGETASAMLSGATLGLIPTWRGAGLRAQDAQNAAFFGAPAGSRTVAAPGTRLLGVGRFGGMRVGNTRSVATAAVPGIANRAQAILGQSPASMAALQTNIAALQAIQKQGQAYKNLSDDQKAFMAGLGEEIKNRQTILAQMRTQDRISRTIRAREKTAPSILAGGRDILGVGAGGKVRSAAEARGNAGVLLSQTLKQMGATTPEGAKTIGTSVINFAGQVEKANPALKGAMERVKSGVLKKFDELDINVKKINGRVLDGTKTKWNQIKRAMETPAEQMKQAVVAHFTEVQNKATGALQAMGFSAAQAQALVARADATGSAPSANPNAPVTNNGKVVKAQGGRITGKGLRDTVPIGPGQMAAPGELVVNRHTENRIDALLRKFGTSLGAEVSREKRPHWAPSSVMSEQFNGIMPGLAAGGRVGGGGGGSPMMRAIRKANEIDSHHYQYAWGGGHGALGVPGMGTLHAKGGPVGLGYDCSGAVSAVLGAAGYLGSPEVSGWFNSFGLPGPDPRGITTYSRAGEATGHVYMNIRGRGFGTSGENPLGGAGWFSGGARGGFTVRHAPNPGDIAIDPIAVPRARLRGLPGGMELGASTLYAGAMTGAMNRVLASSMGFETGGRVNWAGWHGQGGDFRVSRPTLFGAGETGAETVSISRGGSGGGRPITLSLHIDAIHNHGGNVRAEVEAAFDTFARKLGEQGVVLDTAVTA